MILFGCVCNFPRIPCVTICYLHVSDCVSTLCRGSACVAATFCGCVCVVYLIPSDRCCLIRTLECVYTCLGLLVYTAAVILPGCVCVCVSSCDCIVCPYVSGALCLLLQLSAQPSIYAYNLPLNLLALCAHDTYLCDHV